MKGALQDGGLFFANFGVGVAALSEVPFSRAAARAERFARGLLRPRDTGEAGAWGGD